MAGARACYLQGRRTESIVFFFLLVRDISFQKVLVRVLLGFFLIKKVLVFQLHGFHGFLKNYSVEVNRLKKKVLVSYLHGYLGVFD